MLIKHLRRTLLFFSKQNKQKNTSLPVSNQSSSNGSGSGTAAASAPVVPMQQYLVMPTKIPVFPYYYYVTNINKTLYSYLAKNNVRYIAACILKQGQVKKQFKPYYEGHLINQLSLKENLGRGAQNRGIDQNLSDEDIKNSNIIFDESLRSNSDMPVHYIDNINQVHPLASLCKLFLGQNETIYLRSQIRMQINSEKYINNQGKPIMYVSGRKIKNQSTVQMANQYKQLIEAYSKMAQISRINVPTVFDHVAIKSVELLGGFICTLTYFTLDQKYNLFRTINLVQRAKMTTQYLKQYSQSIESEWKKMQKDNEQQIDQQKQKQFYKQIYERFQTFLGLTTDKQYIKKIVGKLASGRYPKAIMKTIQLQLQSMQDLSEGNPQVNKKKQYINLLIDYPFGVVAKQSYDIPAAKKILQQQHYGMKKVKQRILQFIAVSKIKGQFKSKVLLLHGPPGVGKTSIVKSIAKCLNRPYGRISLGGQYDTSIMKGHRKTYIGAYPGKIFSQISKAKVENPVILLDEIDKVQSRQGGGSLQDVIMQVLDPIQNYKFKDEYMDIEVDLSKVLFICTANQLDTIFPPLLDRLERIEVTGYTTGQKMEIFKRYILKQSMDTAGFPQQLQTKIDFNDETLHALIQGYCKQAGIRNLVRKTHTIFNKTALKYVKNQEFDTKITPKTLKQYLGQPRFTQARLFQKIPPKGVMIGLAYNAYGGSIMYIQAAAAHIKESKLLPNTLSPSTVSIQSPSSSPFGSLIVTGNLHNVMKQSCQLAFTYSKYICSVFFNNHFLQYNDIHLNFPEIEIGKDGPSAGVAITCTLVSLALNKPAIREIAMTGQITLTGKVSPIGGVKQKTMGAKRQGITHLIFPEDNRRDVEQLDQQIRNGITFYFAGHFYEVMHIVFGIQISQNKTQQQQISQQQNKIESVINS